MKAARTSSGLPQAERSTFESTLQSGRARVQINHMGVRLNRAPFVISGRGPDARGPSAAGGTSPGSTAAVAFVESVASR